MATAQHVDTNLKINNNYSMAYIKFATQDQCSFSNDTIWESMKMKLRAKKKLPEKSEYLFMKIEVKLGNEKIEIEI